MREHARLQLLIVKAHFYSAICDARWFKLLPCRKKTTTIANAETRLVAIAKLILLRAARELFPPRAFGPQRRPGLWCGDDANPWAFLVSAAASRRSQNTRSRHAGTRRTDRQTQQWAPANHLNPPFHWNMSCVQGLWQWLIVLAKFRSSELIGVEKFNALKTSLLQELMINLYRRRSKFTKWEKVFWTKTACLFLVYQHAAFLGNISKLTITDIFHQNVENLFKFIMRSKNLGLKMWALLKKESSYFYSLMRTAEKT